MNRNDRHIRLLKTLSQNFAFEIRKNLVWGEVVGEKGEEKDEEKGAVLLVDCAVDSPVDSSLPLGVHEVY